MKGDSEKSAPREAILKVKISGQNKRFALAADELVTIGRSSTCGISLQDKSISREHCVAVFTNGKIVINDLRSTHGITSKGERVEHCELHPGDSCHLGIALATFDATEEKLQTRSPAVSTARKHTQPAQPQTAEQVPAKARDKTTTKPVATPARATKQDVDKLETTDRNTSQADNLNTHSAIAGYKIIETLGEGGYGTVYRAEQVQLHREVALKVLKKDDKAQDHEERIASFLREARLAAGLRDPRLVQIYDVGESDGQHFLSMELIEGGSLTRKIRRDGPIPWQAVIRMIRDIALALKVAHAAKLVHRDVKPGNILMTDSGQAKLTDLGLAASGEHAGTIAFISPEQLRRDKIDGRSDIYALGCTAYAALTGSPPFTGNRQEMMRSHLKQKPVPLLDRDIQVPYQLAQLIVESMMAKSPDDRPQDVSALIERLDRLILPNNISSIEADDDANDDEIDYPSVAPIRLGRSRKGANNSQKAILARLTADSIVFAICAVTTIGLLLAMKILWPSADIYSLIGK